MSPLSTRSVGPTPKVSRDVFPGSPPFASKTVLAPETADNRTSASNYRSAPPSRVNEGLWAIADQALFASGSFLIAIVVAKELAPAQYGLFSLMQTIVALVSAIHMGILVEPTLIFGSGRHAHRLPEYIGIIVKINGLLCLGCMLLLGGVWLVSFLLGMESAALTSMGLLLVLAPSLSTWLLRRATFVANQPHLATAASLMYLVSAAVFLELLRVSGRFSLGAAFCASSASLSIGCAWLLKRLGPRYLPIRDALTREIIRENWLYASWSLRAFILRWIPTYSVQWIATFYLGTAGAGDIRALMNPLLPFIQAIGALTAMLVPNYVRTGDPTTLHKRVLRHTFLLGLASAVYASVLSVFSLGLMHRFYGGKYDAVALMLPFFAFVAVPESVIQVMTAFFRSRNDPRSTFLVYLPSAGLALLCTIWLTERFGIEGASAGYLIGYTSAALSFTWLYARRRRNGYLYPAALSPVPTARLHVAGDVAHKLAIEHSAETSPKLVARTANDPSSSPPRPHDPDGRSGDQRHPAPDYTRALTPRRTGEPEYLVFSLRGRSVLAVPSQPRTILRAALSRYQPHSLKRRFYTHVLRSAISLHCERIISEAGPLPTEEELGAASLGPLSGLLSDLRERLGAPSGYPILMWPSQTSRKRLYIHLLDRDLTPLAFVKLAPASARTAGLRSGIETMQEIDQRGLKRLRLPRVLRHGQLESAEYVALQPLPTGARPPRFSKKYNISSLLAEFSFPRCRLSGGDLQGCSWWSEYTRSLQAEHEPFHAALLELLPIGAEVCRVHGDMALANMVIAQEELWLFDWEYSHPQGPATTDEVGYFLSFSVGKTASRPAKCFRAFQRRFLDQATPQQCLDAMLALAYRFACGIPDADFYIRNWPLSLPTSSQ